MKSKILFTCVCIASLLYPAVRAEEGGAGHYMPGATASFIDVLPGREAFVYVNMSTYYDGSAGGSRTLRFGGLLAANVEATVYANTSVLLYQTPWKILGGQYAAGLGIPYYDMEVEATVTLDPALGGGAPSSRRDTASGIGDILLMPFMLGWKKGDVSYGTSLGVYAPTGEYEQGELANLGKNYWTFEPGVNVSWLSSKIGTEVSAFAGYDISTKNEDSDYQSGDVFHFDTTVAQHLPLFGGFIGVGANAFYYEQVTGDSGDGAKLGDFEGKTMGVGPVLSYAAKVGKAKTTDLVCEVKWLPETDVEKRLEGDIIWAKVALVF
jgi:hypothetical protein